MSKECMEIFYKWRNLENMGEIPISHSVQFSSVQLLSHVQLFATSWTAACQASLSISNSWSLLKLMFIKLVMPSNHLILCHVFPTKGERENKNNNSNSNNSQKNFWEVMDKFMPPIVIMVSLLCV